MVGHLCRSLDCCKKVILYQLQDKAEHQAVGTINRWHISKRRVSVRSNNSYECQWRRLKNLTLYCKYPLYQKLLPDVRTCHQSNRSTVQAQSKFPEHAPRATLFALYPKPWQCLGVNICYSSNISSRVFSFLNPNSTLKLPSSPNAYFPEGEEFTPHLCWVRVFLPRWVSKSKAHLLERRWEQNCMVMTRSACSTWPSKT